MFLQLSHEITDWAWLNITEVVAHPPHFTSIKQEFGAGINRFSLCFCFSDYIDGCNKSVSIIEIWWQIMNIIFIIQYSYAYIAPFVAAAQIYSSAIMRIQVYHFIVIYYQNQLAMQIHVPKAFLCRVCNHYHFINGSQRQKNPPKIVNRFANTPSYIKQSREQILLSSNELNIRDISADNLGNSQNVANLYSSIKDNKVSASDFVDLMRSNYFHQYQEDNSNNKNLTLETKQDRFVNLTKYDDQKNSTLQDHFLDVPGSMIQALRNTRLKNISLELTENGLKVVPLTLSITHKKLRQSKLKNQKLHLECKQKYKLQKCTLSDNRCLGFDCSGFVESRFQTVILNGSHRQILIQK